MYQGFVSDMSTWSCRVEVVFAANVLTRNACWRLPCCHQHIVVRQQLHQDFFAIQVHEYATSQPDNFLWDSGSLLYRPNKTILGHKKDRNHQAASVKAKCGGPGRWPGGQSWFLRAILFLLCHGE